MKPVHPDPMTPRRRVASAAVAVALVLGVAACGGGSDTTSTAASGATQGAANGIVAAAARDVQQLYAGQFFKEPPATSPPAQRGKNVWEVTVGLDLPASGLYADAQRQAAKALGWKLTVFDAKLDPSQFQVGIRQAIAAKADGILLYNIDCPLAQSAMAEARARNIPIVGAESLDCPYFKQGAPSLFSGAVIYTQGSFPNWVHGLGKAQADWLISKTGGHAKTIVFSQKDLTTGILVDQGFRRELAKCTTCKIVKTVPFTAADLGPALQSKTEQAILQAPEADSVQVPYDDLITAGIAAAVQSSGRADQLQVIAGGGYKANLDLVRKHQGQNAGYNSSIPWEGYAAADTLNRIFAGQKGANSGNGIGLFDREHNLNTTGDVKVPIDFVSAYEHAWAAGKG